MKFDISSSKLFAQLQMVSSIIEQKNTISILDGLIEINTVSDARRLIDAVYNSKELINNFAQNVRAGQAVISDPLNDEMLDTRNSCYEKFYSLMTATRDTTYPTVQIGFIDESSVIRQ